MLSLLIELVVMAATALCFLLAGDEERRRRMFVFASPAPLALLVPAVLLVSREGLHDAVVLLVLVGLALSLSLSVVGAALLVRARHLRETRAALGASLLLAALPLAALYAGAYFDLFSL